MLFVPIWDRLRDDDVSPEGDDLVVLELDLRVFVRHIVRHYLLILILLVERYSNH